MEIIEFDLKIREEIINNITYSIKITTSILLMSIVLFFVSLMTYTQNIYFVIASIISFCIKPMLTIQIKMIGSIKPELRSY